MCCVLCAVYACGRVWLAGGCGYMFALWCRAVLTIVNGLVKIRVEWMVNGDELANG